MDGGYNINEMHSLDALVLFECYVFLLFSSSSSPSPRLWERCNIILALGWGQHFIFIIIAFTRPSPRCRLETKGMGSGVIWPRLVAGSGGMTKKKTESHWALDLMCHFIIEKPCLIDASATVLPFHSQVPYILLTHIFDAEDPPLAPNENFMQLWWAFIFLYVPWASKHHIGCIYVVLKFNAHIFSLSLWINC